MNFRNFKKVSEDADKAVMRHPNGHSITISKKGLSPKLATELKNLPLHQADPDGEVGGPPEPGDDNATVQPQQQPPDAAPSAQEPQPAPQLVQPQDVQTPAGAPGPGNIVEQGQQQAVSAPPMNTTEQYQQNYLDQANKYAQDLASGHVQPMTYSQLFAKKDTLGKIGTLFGLLVGGAGSGITGQPNPVLKMMEQEINNDFEAQKASKANAQNFLRLNQQNELQKAQIPDLLASGKLKGAQALQALAATNVDATTNAIMQVKLSLMHGLVGHANKLPPNSPTGAAARQALQGVGQATMQSIQQDAQNGAAQKAALEAQFGQRGELETLAGLGDVANFEAQRHVPGIGNSSIPVPDSVRKELTTRSDYDKAAQQYLDFAKQHQGNWENWAKLHPQEALEVNKQGGVLGAILQSKYMAAHPGFGTSGERKELEKLIPSNPVSMFARFNQLPKVSETLQSNRMSANTTAEKAGLPHPYEETQTESPKKATKASAPREGQTGTIEGKPVVFKNGKWNYR